MVMLVCRLLVSYIFLCSLALSEEILIDSIQSSERVVLKCGEDELELSIMGESGALLIKRENNDGVMYLIEIEKQYRNPIYIENHPVYKYEAVKKTLIADSSQIYIDETKKNYNLLRKALREAHDNQSCLTAILD